MAKLDRDTLKSYFETGDIPTENQFSSLIDSYPNLIDESEVFDANGFPVDQKEDTSLSYDGGTRTFTITPDSAMFHFYELGEKFEKSILCSVIWPDVEGDHWFYFENGTLSVASNPSESEKENIILNHALVAFIYWNATDSEIEIDIFEERHGISMSPYTHLYLHLTRGAQYVSGLAVGNIIADGDGDEDIHAQFSVSAGVFFDEDLPTTPIEINVGDTIPVVYNGGAGVLLRSDLQTGFGVLNAPGGRLYYNENVGGVWQLTEVSNSDYVLYHIFAVNGVDVGTISVMGQNEYGNTSSARAGASTEISNLLSDLPFAEMIPLATIIYQTRDTYDNAVKGRIRSTDTGEDFIDWRITELAQGVPASSHANLTNLDLAITGVTWGHIDDQTQTIAGNKVFSNQAHGGDSLETFSAAKTFDANNGNNQKMLVTASTTIGITNELPGTYVFVLEIDTATPPTITIGASFGTVLDNSADLITEDNDINILTLVVDTQGNKYYTINTLTA